jgi:hypothetical protein
MRNQVGTVLGVVVVSLLLFGCGQPDLGAREASPDLSMDPAANATSIADELRASGYWVGEGRYWFMMNAYADEFIEATGNTFGVNPNSPYGMYLLPAAPGEYRPPEGDWDQAFQLLGQEQNLGLRAVWQLRPDEAILFVGRTPGNARYFAFTNVVMHNPSGRQPGASIPVHFTETDLPINHKVIAAQSAAGLAYDQTIAVITTADDRLAQRLTARLVESGLPRDLIFLQRISGEDDLTLGYGEQATTFMALNRVAFMQDGESYFGDPPAVVYRIVPETPVTPTFYPRFEQPLLADGANEDDLKDALAALAAAVERAHAQPGAQLSTLRMFNYPLETETCLRLTLPCEGTIDANYGFSLKRELGPGSLDYVVVVGVNHTATGKATYTSLSFYDSATNSPVAAMNDAVMPGSVDPYLALVDRDRRALVRSHRDQLYVHRFARACDTADTHCSVVPLTGEPGRYVAADGEQHLFERAYLDPAGMHGPAFFELLAPFEVISSAAAESGRE